jgi:hypothetical protein
MPAQRPLFQQVLAQIQTIARPAHVRASSVRRLALLVSGLVAAQHAALAQIAAEVQTLQLSQTARAEHVERRLRRALNDPRLQPRSCYEPAVKQAVDWDALRRGRQMVTVLLDESSKADEIHLLRASLAYWGGSLPLAWAVWEQNTPLTAGRYWTELDRVLDRVAAILPAGLPVLVLADRAFDIPPFIDRLRKRGWHWIVRLKARSSLRFQDHQGREGSLAERVRRQLGTPGRRWKTRGRIFKRAGWRAASVVGVWAAGEAEPLVVLTDLPPRWSVLQWYGRRFWIEAGFRNDKARGWQWEASQVRGVAHNERLLLAMAWASLLSLCVGVQEARSRLQAVAQPAQRPVRAAKPQHARQSVFTLGLRAVRRWLYQLTDAALSWRLPEPNAPSWSAQWYRAQSFRYIFQSVRP